MTRTLRSVRKFLSLVLVFVSSLALLHEPRLFSHGDVKHPLGMRTACFTTCLALIGPKIQATSDRSAMCVVAKRAYRR